MSKATAKTPTRSPAAKRPAAAKRKASKAVKAAREHGAKGRKVSAAQRALRDSAIMACSEAGWMEREIAAEFELTTRQVRRIVGERREMPSGLHGGPMEILDELLRGYRASIADFELMAFRYRDGHPNVALGAKRGAVDTRERYAQLLSAVGKLPENLELFRSESVLRQIADEMMDTMDGLRSGDVSVEEAHEFFSRIVDPEGQRALPAAA